MLRFERPNRNTVYRVRICGSARTAGEDSRRI
jgi:hypothetical protein